MRYFCLLLLANTIIPAFAQGGEIDIQRNVTFLEPSRNAKLDLYLPAQKEGAISRRPAIVIIHGGGWHSGDKAAAREKNIATHLANAGYVCASVNYYLAKKEELFTDNLRQVWPQNLQDCMTAVRFLRAQAEKYRIDPTKIGAIGGSAGGHLAAMLAYVSDGDDLDPKNGPYPKYSARIQAVVPMYGVYDLLAHAEQKDVLTKLTEDDRKLCQAASPVSYLDRSDPPALLLHGTRDPLVNYRQSEQFHVALEKAGISSKLHIIKGAKHSFHLQPPQEDLRELVVGFFDEHLRE